VPRIPETITPIAGVQPNPDASLSIYALATSISRFNQPVDPGSVFAPGFDTLFIFYAFDNMNWGVPVTRALYRDGELTFAAQDPWNYYPSGRAYYYFFDLNQTYEPGDYEVQLFIGETLAARETFTVREINASGD
jgi:hypothetical protein